MDKTLLTDEAVEAAAKAVLIRRNRITGGDSVWPSDEFAAIDACAAFVAHHEGERPCERCGGAGYFDFNDKPDPNAPELCPDCGATGKVREDRLVKLSEVVAALRGRMLNPPFIDAGEFIEREFGGGR